MDINKYRNRLEREKVIAEARSKLRKDIKANSDYRRLQLIEQEHSLRPIVKAVEKIPVVAKDDEPQEVRVEGRKPDKRTGYFWDFEDFEA